METQALYSTTTEVIDFSYNWNNKLTGNYFTTLRLYNIKYTIGKRFIVRLKGQALCQVEVMETRILLLKDVNDWIAGIDTGYSKEEAQNIIKKMYSGKNWEVERLVLVLLKKVKGTEVK